MAAPDPSPPWPSSFRPCTWERDSCPPPGIRRTISGFLFGVVPVRQVLRTNPYEVVKSGSTGRTGRRITERDLLLVVQIAICALLVPSSLVAVRGLVRSLHGNFGCEPRANGSGETTRLIGQERGSLLWAALMLEEELPQEIGGVDFVSRAPSDPFWQGLTAWKGVASTVHSIENHVRILSAVRVFETVDARSNASIDRVSATLVAPRPTRHPSRTPW